MQKTFWDPLAALVLLLLSCQVLIVRADQGSFTPGCSFVGNQCMYTVQLGHQNQCDSVQTSCPSSSQDGQCCETLRTDVTNVKNEISNLKSQLAQLQGHSTDPSINITQIQIDANKVEAERDALLLALKQKEQELNTTKTELSRVISQSGREIETLRSSLTNTTLKLQTCQQALGITTAPPPSDSNENAQLTYCKFDALDDCGFKSLSGSVQFSLMSKSVGTQTGPTTGHSTGTPGDKWIGLDVQSLNKYSFTTSTVKSATIESGEFDPASNYCIRFWYSMRGPDVFGLDVKVRIGGGTGYPVFSQTGNQNVDWLLGEIQLDSEYTANPFKLDFVAKTDMYYKNFVHHNRYGDIGIDDVYVYNTSCSAIPRCLPQSVKRTSYSPTNTTSCYTIHPEAKTWEDAYDTCRREGAESALVSIESKDEHDFLANLIKNDPVYSMSGNAGFYTCGSDRGTEQTFAWTNTGSDRALTYTNWHVGQPNNVGGNQDCLLLEYPNDNFAWGDVDCDTKHPFICEVSY